MKEQVAQIEELSQLNTEYLQTFGFPTPRFHPREQLPPLREGEVLGKFFGAPVRLPARDEGELVDAAGYTQAQRDRLEYFADVRRNLGMETLRAMQDPEYQIRVRGIYKLDMTEGVIHEL